MPSTTAANSFAIGLNRMGTSMFLPTYKVFGARCRVPPQADPYWIGIDLYGSLVRSHAGAARPPASFSLTRSCGGIAQGFEPIGVSSAQMLAQSSPENEHQGKLVETIPRRPLVLRTIHNSVA